MTMTMYGRDQAFEAKFVHDEELRFLVMARRNKLFGRWAAAELGLPDNESEALFKAVLAIPDGRGHDQALLKYIGDLLYGRDSEPQARLSVILDRCMGEARAQLAG